MVQVYRAPDLTGERTIDEDGFVTVPLAGQIAAAGKVPSELAEAITQKLRARYYQDPQVSVAIKDALGRRVTVDGSVRDPGIYPIDASTTLLRAVALANGETEYANIRRIVVFRTIGGKRMAAAFDLHAVREGLQPDPAIYPGDIVVIDGNGLRETLRDVLQAIPLLAIFQPF